MTLHTDAGCTLDAAAAMTVDAVGTVLSTTCDAAVDGNAGCGVADPDPASYGHDFNVDGGGELRNVCNTQRNSRAPHRSACEAAA